MTPEKTTSWAEERSQMRAAATNVILHLHPTRVPAAALRFTYTWGLGGMSATLAVLLVLTGVLLQFRYDATIEGAYTSILLLESQVKFGSLIRSIHHWSANLLVVTVFLHLLRVFLTGGFKRDRATNWLIGLGLLIVVLAFNFTGYLLPWDQLAYWAATVSTSLIDYIPVVGTAVSNFILGGTEIGQNTLRNFYALHVAVLPVILAAALTYHFWRIRRDGGISQPENVRQGGLRLTTIPHLVRRETAVGATLIAAVLIWSMFIPAPLAELANPALSPNPAKAAWYFLGLQELLLHMQPLAAMSLTGIVLAGLLLLPRWDRQDSDIGVYFRSRRGRTAALIGAILGLQIVPVLVIVDELWLDWTVLFPTLPAFVANGLLPLALTLLGLAAIYAGLRWLLRTNHSEAFVGLFSFIMASLVMLTVIGVYFRGENMVLLWPW
ncbi:MAG: cytochrome b N-terminal domain-containing protein [Chloroflexi bacterium]|nr:cytochrome b N-terminal domain-containing protein [Chloroflexota bacterium]